MSKKEMMVESVVLTEVVTRILKWKEEKDRIKEEKRLEDVRKAADPIIETYAAVLGWCSAEDEVVDIQKCKEGLIKLVQEYRRITGNGSVWVPASGIVSRSNNGGDYLRKERELLDNGYSKEEVLYFEKIVQAYGLLYEIFADFNDFVEGLWVELQTERQSAIEGWEKRKAEMKKETLAKIDEEVDKRVEVEFQVLKETDVGKNKRVLPAKRREEIYREVRGSISSGFTESKPEFSEINFQEKIEQGKMSKDELVREVGKISNN